jgi:hypothetical protein
MTPIDSYAAVRRDLPDTWVTDLLELGYDVNQPDDAGDRVLTLACGRHDGNAVALALAAGADPNGKNAGGDTPLQCLVDGWSGSDAQRTFVSDTVRALIAAGANAAQLDQRDISVVELLLVGPPVVRPSAEHFFAWRSPRMGVTNPTVMNSPVWEWLVRTGLGAYAATEAMPGPHPDTDTAGWSFRRFGRSTTVLPDGRTVFIAGEHEDWYDTDFFIYNDVVVAHPDGRLDIYGYPRADFPPTDFHSATRVGGAIVLIGCLGYPESRRFGQTQVLTLDLTTFEVRSVATVGDPPGWISHHTATLSRDGTTIVVRGGTVLAAPGSDAVENQSEWVLDLATWSWSGTAA